MQLVVSGVESIISDSEVDTCLLHQYEEQLSGIKTELTSVSDDILALDRDEGALSKQDTKLNQAIFEVRLKIKRLLQGEAKPAPCSAEEGGVKLPRLDVPTFDGNIVNWRSFWEQLSVSVHDRRKLSDSEKLTYLRHALKDGTAKYMVQGLLGSGVHYAEAIDCLQKCYSRPRKFPHLHQLHRSLLSLMTLVWCARQAVTRCMPAQNSNRCHMIKWFPP